MNWYFTNRFRECFVCKIQSQLFKYHLHALRFKFQFQEKVSRTRARTTYKKIDQLFVFLNRYSQINMRNRKKLNSHWSVRFANFAYSFTTSRNQIFFEVIQSKNSNLSTETFKLISESMKNVSNQKVTCVRTICRLCKQNFNFNETLYEHIRNHEILKFVKDFYFSINAINLVCKTMKKSIVTDSSVSQKLDILFATSKQKFESVLIFEAIILSENSHLLFNASEIVLQSMKNKLIRCFSISSKTSFSKIFESERQEVFVQKFYFIDAFFSNNTVNLTCEIAKNSTNVSAKNVDVRANSKIKRSNFQLRTFEFISQSTKIESNQCSFVSFISLFSIFKKSCSICRIEILSVKEHYFEFSSCHEALRHRLEFQFAFRAHQREQETQTQTEIEKAIDQLVKNFHLSINAVNFVCEIKKTSFVSHKSKSTKKTTTCRRCNQIFNVNNKFHEHLRQHHARKSVKNFDFRIFASKFAYKIRKKLVIVCSSVSSNSSATSRSRKFWFSIIFELMIASTRSNFPIATYKSDSKSMRKLSDNCSFIFFVFVFSDFDSKTSKTTQWIIFYCEWFESHVSWKV